MNLAREFGYDNGCPNAIKWYRTSPTENIKAPSIVMLRSPDIKRYANYKLGSM